MVKDEKAESLEKACLYHRVASRWLIVLNQCTNQSDKLWVSRRRSLCLRKARQKRKKIVVSTQSVLFKKNKHIPVIYYTATIQRRETYLPQYHLIATISFQSLNYCGFNFTPHPGNCGWDFLTIQVDLMMTQADWIILISTVVIIIFGIILYTVICHIFKR